PRPPNAWIIYRTDKLKELKELAKPQPGQPKEKQADLSTKISLMWRNETEEVKKEYERRAERAKAEHARLYPDYKFEPKKKADK
ncbi:high mobility group box, partial [Peniophora sp. CONT]